MSSQVLRGPTPIMEKTCRPSLVAATALPETAAGMEGIFFTSSAPGTVAAQSSRTIRNGGFFIAEILPQVAGFGAGSAKARMSRWNLKALNRRDRGERPRRA